MLDAVSTSLSGINYATDRLGQAGATIAASSKDGGAVDEALIDAAQAKTDYAANAKVLKAQLDNEKRLLDVLA